MTGVISEDALQGQQSRIMNAMKAAAAPTQQQVSPQDLLQALTAGNTHGGNFLESLKAAQTGQAQGNLAAETGIYNQMKEQVARGNENASAIDKAITDVTGDDPKLYASVAAQLHADPEPVTPANAKQKVMKYASEMGINPLSNQESRAKVAKLQAEASKTQNEANQLKMFDSSPNVPKGLPATPQANGVTPATTQGATNETYLAQLPTPVASQVKALAEGRMQFPSGYALKTPYWQQMLQAVSNYDPNFDAVNYNARASTRKDFTSGKSAQNITALNTAIGHLDALDKAFAGLKNSDYPVYNSVANAIARNTGDKNVQGAMRDVESKANAVADELAKVFRSTGMSQTEIESWKKLMSTSTTPTEQKKIVESAIELMNSRLDAIGEQYNKGMGTTKDPMELLTPKAQKILVQLKSSVTPSESAPETNNSGKVIDYKEYFK